MWDAPNIKNGTSKYGSSNFKVLFGAVEASEVIVPVERWVGFRFWNMAFR